MDYAKKLLDLLDQPPSETAWVALTEALEQMHGGDLEAILPELMARLGAWPDDLRVHNASKDKGNYPLPMEIYRVFAMEPDLTLSDVFEQEKKKILGDQAKLNVLSEPNGDFFSIEAAHQSSKRRLIKGQYYDDSKAVMYCLQSDYIIDPGVADPAYDHLFRIDYQRGDTLRMHSFSRRQEWTLTDCLLLHPLADDTVLLVLAEQKREWIGHASIYILAGQTVVFEHHFIGQHERWGEVPQLSRQTIFRYAPTQRQLWGVMQTGEVAKLDVDQLVWKVTKTTVGEAVDACIWGSGLIISEQGGTLTYLDSNMEDCPIPPPSPPMSPTCLLDLCKWVSHEEDDPNDDNPGRVHTLYLHHWNADLKHLTEGVHLDIFYKRLGWESIHFSYKRRQTHLGWRVAFLAPPDFDELFVFELPTGRQASLYLDKSQLFDPRESFDFDASGSSILFQNRDSIWRWHFVLEELSEYESRFYIIPDSGEI